MAEAAYADLETRPQAVSDPPVRNNAWAAALARGNVTRCVTQTVAVGHKAP